MYCHNCGAYLSSEAGYCASCGINLSNAGKSATGSLTRCGFSPRISDPAFARYLKNSNHWAVIFSSILAVAAVVGFYINGEVSTEMDNPESLYIGFVIGGMFLTIAFFTVIGRRASKTWDGTVHDKQVREKTKKQTYGDGEVKYEDYLEYSVAIIDDSGKKHVLRYKNDDTKYNYYRIGDRVRHHGGLNSFEKYDKTGDSIIFCSACGTLCNIDDEYCFRCKCPLLK